MTTEGLLPTTINVDGKDDGVSPGDLAREDPAFTSPATGPGKLPLSEQIKAAREIRKQEKEMLDDWKAEKKKDPAIPDRICTDEFLAPLDLLLLLAWTSIAKDADKFVKYA